MLPNSIFWSKGRKWRQFHADIQDARAGLSQNGEIDAWSSFLQIYFVGDDDNQRDIRCGYFTGVKPELVGQLQKLLHEHNKYIKAADDSIPEGHKDFQVVINANKKPLGVQRGRFNAPTTNQVALVIVGQAFESRDIVLPSRDSHLVRITTLQYPLMFCRGEDGYSIDIAQHDPNTKAY